MAEALAWLTVQNDLKLDSAAERAIAEAMQLHLSSVAVCAPATAIFAEATKRSEFSVVSRVLLGVHVQYMRCIVNLEDSLIKLILRSSKTA